MKLVYQTIIDRHIGNCAQAAIASLLDLELKQVPNFKLWNEKFWSRMVSFLNEQGYEFHGTIINPRLHAAESYDLYYEEKDRKLPENRYKEIKDMPGVNGYFFGTVYSPKFYDPLSIKQITHAVVIDKEFNIVNPVNKDYEGLDKFPLHDLIGYNGVINFLMIEKK